MDIIFFVNRRAKMFLAMIIFVLFVIMAGGASLVILSKKDFKKKKLEVKEVEQKHEDDFGGVEHHIDEFLQVEFLEDGIFKVGNTYCGIGKIEGTNFSVMSEADQNTRESVFIDLLTGIDYPVQFVTTSVVADTGKVAKDIAVMASQMPDSTIKVYASLYAKALDDMHRHRQILSQCSWMVLTDSGIENDPVYKLKEKMGLLASALRQRAGVIFTPLLSVDDVVDVFGQIIDPESLTRPSELLPNRQPIHVSQREVVKFETQAVQA
jgi:hypothetical protein